MDKLTRLVEEMKAHLKTARDIAAVAEKDGDRDFTDDERATVTEAMAKAADAKKRLDSAKADEKTRAAIRELGDGIGLDAPGEKRSPSGLVIPDGRKSLGQHFVESAEYKGLLDSVPGGHFTKDHRVQARPVGYKQLLSRKRGQKALITGGSDTSAGSMVVSDELGLQVGLETFQRPLMLRDLVTGGQTTSDTVEYVRITSTTNAAAPVPEATATAGVSGVKPESTMTTAKITTPVRTIANWIPVTKRALSDAAQIMTLIDNFLVYNLEEELDDQMISGDGTGENLEGLSTVSGVQTQAFDTDLLTTLRKAKTKVRITGRSVPTGYVLNPLDVEALDLLTDGETRFYFGGPSGTMVGEGGAAGPLWNLPVIESEAVAAGTAWVGDWRKAILWDRQQASITMTDSHADFFIRNMVAILAEMRCAFGVIQPSAFVSVDLVNPVTP